MRGNLKRGNKMTRQNKLIENNQESIGTLSEKMKGKIGPEEGVKQEKIIPYLI